MSETSKVKRAGVIGLGAMGVQMARHMVGKGFDVVGYDVDVDAMRRAVEHGVQSCLSPSQVGEHAEVIVVMVATDDQVAAVIEQSGLLDRLQPGSVICIASSCAPETCRRLAMTASQDWHGLRPCVPVPAGGMTRDRVPEMLDFYGADVMLLIGGALLAARERLTQETAAFVAKVKGYRYG